MVVDIISLTVRFRSPAAVGITYAEWYVWTKSPVDGNPANRS